ncbi:disease resistance protein [Gossypium australe]|uniref:Disease resistance protein n=1 Tax=Gossypium australe TaxID=47621 RepID=A0A5B6VU18_9ROSI|nr:disease resistance protein [Gossypium australe]
MVVLRFRSFTGEQKYQVSRYHFRNRPISIILSKISLVEHAGTVFEAANTIRGLIENHWEFPKGIDQNVNNLKRKRDQLNGQKEDIESRIKSELRPRKKVKKEVDLWIENVKGIDGEIPNLESKVRGSSFFSRGFLVKNVRKKEEEVEELLEKGRFSDDLVVIDLSWIGQVLPTPSLVVETVKRKKNEIMQHLRNDEVQKIGVYGMPGVGKTSVVTLVNNELLKGEIEFKIIVWVTVGRKCSVIDLQNRIAKAMNVSISEDEDETLRAGMLSEILSEKYRFVLILDDVWERFSFEKVGIPESSEGKLVLTSCSLDVCRRMDCQVEKMEPLSNEDAWTLFSDKVGQSLMSSVDLVPIAKSIVEHCAGLPLVIVIVASTMRGEDSLPIWRNALAELNRKISSIIDVKDKVYQQLRFSYDRLKDQRIQNCFLNCALYREDSGILKEQLIRDWIEKGLIEEMGSLEANMDKGHAILRTLVDNCLLENVGNERVRMHDLVTDMAKLSTQDLYES